MVGGVAHWNVLFTRNAQDWELEMVMSFFDQLYSTRVRHGKVDREVWILSKRRNFEVKTFYKALVCPEAASFPWNGIWRVKAPKRVVFFVWTTALGKILTHDNLRRRGIVVVEWCVMCKKHGNPLITFFSIVTWLGLFGVSFIICLGWSGLCVVVSWIY
jgi:hypothetical protein